MNRESAWIDRFTRAFAKARIGVGIGDDAAVLRPAPGVELCVTTDSIVEDVHFTRTHFAPGDIGHKALAVNLSDLAAMGARPAWFVCAMEVPTWVDERFLDALARGMARLARTQRILLVGGNFSRARSLAVTIAAIGEVQRGRALLRSGAARGDRLYVSGTLGDARLGLVLLEQRRRGRARIRQLRPAPRTKLGMIARRFASAAIDVSDGLGRDAANLARASAARVRIDLSRLPISTELRRFSGDAAPLWAANGGEDYELLLAVPERRSRAFETACARAGEHVTRIGEIESGSGVVMVDLQGRVVPTPEGFDHFAARGRRIDPPGHHK